MKPKQILILSIPGVTFLSWKILMYLSCIRVELGPVSCSSESIEKFANYFQGTEGAIFLLFYILIAVISAIFRQWHMLKLAIVWLCCVFIFRSMFNL